MPDPRPYLVVSASGRMLAVSAHKAGLPVFVLDLFDDLDTRAVAVTSARCATSSGGFSARRLLAYARTWSQPAGFAGIVVGSGLEGRTRLHRRLAGIAPLLGNTPECVALVKAPQDFFALLDQVNAPHPDVALQRPATCAGWLSKRIGAAGGAHVRPAEMAAGDGHGRYYQRFVAGVPMSVVFLADGLRAEILGFNRLLSVRLSARQPFAFAGAVTEPSPDAEIREQLSRIVGQLTQACGLRGLNGLDFILTAKGPQVIEVNPRPTASMVLYEDLYSRGLFAAHLEACTGHLRQPDDPQSSQVRAMAIAWTRGFLRVTERMQWPDWTTDIPAPGSIIGPHRPLCTVHGHAVSPEAAAQLVQERVRTVIELLRPV